MILATYDRPKSINFGLKSNFSKVTTVVLKVTTTTSKVTTTTFKVTTTTFQVTTRGLQVVTEGQKSVFQSVSVVIKVSDMCNALVGPAAAADPIRPPRCAFACGLFALFRHLG